MPGSTFAFRISIMVVLATAITACAGGRDRREQLAYIERPAETIYSEAVNKLETRRMTEAIQLFDEVERQHPYSDWARRAMLMAAYASYEAGDHDTSIATLQRYIALHPGGASTPYAYYLVALNHYERILDVGRDQLTTRNALDALRQVERRYPDTDYARDARLKIEMTLDHLAGKEMDVGRYYLRAGHELAAINRFRTVLSEYDKTSHVPEALHRLVEAYTTLGVMDEAVKAGAVLGYNYPGSDWYQDSYAILSRNGMAPQLAEAGVAGEVRDGVWARTLGRLF
jgi:outer membrane protein assembly factor BamD